MPVEQYKQTMQSGIIFLITAGLSLIIFVCDGRRVNVRQEKESFQQNEHF